MPRKQRSSFRLRGNAIFVWPGTFFLQIHSIGREHQSKLINLLAPNVAFLACLERRHCSAVARRVCANIQDDPRLWSKTRDGHPLTPLWRLILRRCCPCRLANPLRLSIYLSVVACNTKRQTKCCEWATFYARVVEHNNNDYLQRFTDTLGWEDAVKWV